MATSTRWAASSRRPRLVLGLFVPLALAGIADYLSIRLGEPTWLQLTTGFIFLVGLAMSPVLLHRSLAAPEASAFHLSPAARLAPAVLLSGLWGATAFILFANIHMVLGGTH